MIRKSIIAIVILLVVFISFFFLKEPSKTTVMPQALIGVWTTDAPRYAGRSFKLDKMLVTLDLGDYGTTVYPFKGLKQRMDGNREFFEIVYGPHNEPEQVLRFEYRRANGGTIHIRNQKDVVWTRRVAP